MLGSFVLFVPRLIDELIASGSLANARKEVEDAQWRRAVRIAVDRLDEEPLDRPA